MKARILGLGQWFPESIRTTADWPSAFVESAAQQQGERELVDVPVGGSGDLCDRIVARHLAVESSDPFLGTRNRRVAAAEMSAWKAECQAAEAAMADAGLRGSDVDMIASWSVVPDQLIPPTAARVAHEIGASRAFAVGVDAACASVPIQLRCAAAMIESGQIRTALLTQSHLMTRTMPWSHPASPNVGDGATAVVVGRGAGLEILGHHAVTHGEYSDTVTWIRSRGAEPPWWQAGGAYHLGSKDRAGVRELLEQTVRFGSRTVRELVNELDVPISRVAVLAAVQPRGWVPGAIAEVLGLPADHAPTTFTDYAHLGACGVVANLVAARAAGRLGQGALVALYAQGAGFTRSATLLRCG